MHHDEILNGLVKADPRSHRSAQSATRANWLVSLHSISRERRPSKLERLNSAIFCHSSIGKFGIVHAFCIFFHLFLIYDLQLCTYMSWLAATVTTQADMEPPPPPQPAPKKTISKSKKAKFTLAQSATTWLTSSKAKKEQAQKDQAVNDEVSAYKPLTARETNFFKSLLKSTNAEPCNIPGHDEAVRFILKGPIYKGTHVTGYKEQLCQESDARPLQHCGQVRR